MPTNISRKTKRELVKAFKLSGLTISGDALKGVWRQLTREEDQAAALGVIIQSTKSYFKQFKTVGAVITKDIIEKVVAELSKDDDDRAEESLKLISAFEHANLAYNTDKKEFYVVPAEHSSLNGSAKRKMEMYQTRLNLVRQRILRNPIFKAPAYVGITSDKGSYFNLCAIESLIGTNGQQCVLGMLFKSNGKLYLEDGNSQIELAVNEDTRIHDGLYTETCVVIVDGVYDDGIFIASTIGMPPPETRNESLRAFGSISMLGLDFNSEAYADILRVEEQQKDLRPRDQPTFVVLSEVHLDRPEVLEKLRNLFDTLEASKQIPSIIVFMGNFSSRPFGYSYSDRTLYQKGFDALADLLLGYREITSSSRFVFVPGPTDPGAANVLPRMPIPSVFASKLLSRLGANVVHFTSNPARLRFYTQELIFFREDLVGKMRRQEIIPRFDSATVGGSSSEGGQASVTVPAPVTAAASPDITSILAKTIMDQGHLCPLPLQSRPVFWEFDHALRTYPQPTALFLGDKSDAWHHHYKGSLVVNPGSFSTDFSFMLFKPTTGKLDPSRVR